MISAMVYQLLDSEPRRHRYRLLTCSYCISSTSHVYTDAHEALLYHTKLYGALNGLRSCLALSDPQKKSSPPQRIVNLIMLTFYFPPSISHQ